ncbi:enoyl-CoA hydratase-related protein [Nonomuraea wenchangensis]|uniref:enoyl-CoA hydratase-related protein n=1 Tax=Nonomuraea wenchangensis TaxID=568860 RepID=UPI0034160604
MGISGGDELLVEDVELVRVLTINRPSRLNALSRSLGQALGAAFRDADADPAVRAVVLVGAGTRAFCAGGDLKEMAEGGNGSGVRIVTQALASRPGKPLVAAVNGLAFGGGLELVLACDLAVCAGRATFALPEVRRGVLATGGGLVRLPQVVGVRRAMQMALTGQVIDAATALSWGLVNEVVEDGALLDRAAVLATAIAANAPLSVAASKAVIYESSRLPEQEAWALNERYHARIAASQDALEGPRAFREKRAPVWTGR